MSESYENHRRTKRHCLQNDCDEIRKKKYLNNHQRHPRPIFLQTKEERHVWSRPVAEKERNKRPKGRI